ncbi:MAG: diacylglycerol kinase family protein [Dissulfurispiraceae bacterium]|nr:diacylglycerol kinase family protein [Dissulfurispiraceae bacterium]
MKRKVFIIANPAAGSSSLKKIDKAFKAVKSGCADAELLLTQAPLDAEQYARRIADEYGAGSSLSKIIVIAAGGDGTYNEAANGLAHSGIPLAILPMGTTSVLALELDIPFNIDAAAAAALNGFTIKVSPAKITLSDGSSRLFLLMAGIGFDGETVNNVNKIIKKLSGKAAYIMSGISTLLAGQELFSADITDDRGVISTIECSALIASKASHYAGKFSATPDAKITSPYIHLFAGHSSKRIDVARYVFGIASGRHLGFNDITYTKSTRLVINGSPHIQIDGDYLGRGPAVIESEPEALSIVVSRSWS